MKQEIEIKQLEVKLWVYVKLWMQFTDKGHCLNEIFV